MFWRAWISFSFFVSIVFTWILPLRWKIFSLIDGSFSKFGLMVVLYFLNLLVDSASDSTMLSVLLIVLRSRFCGDLCWVGIVSSSSSDSSLSFFNWLYVGRSGSLSPDGELYWPPVFIYVDPYVGNWRNFCSSPPGSETDGDRCVKIPLGCR